MKSKSFETATQFYTTTQVLGQGGAGIVYKVVDASGKEYALKLLTETSTDKRKRFSNELNFGIKNQHNNIITVTDYGTSPDGPFYVMPLLDKSLRDLIKQGINPKKVSQYFSQLLDGVEAAHKLGVTHRDLKPENILYDAKNDRLLIADFGVARFTEDMLTTVDTKPGARLANYMYAAPEQKNTKALVDQRADIHALGLMLNEMFTGEVPLGTNYKTIESVSPEDAYLDDLVSLMIRQDPSQRPASIEVIKKELIGRRDEFVHLQKLSQLNKTVIKVSDIDDPLVIDPPRLVNVDYDPENEEVEFILSKPVHSLWQSAFNQIENFPFLMGREPDKTRFFSNTGRVPAKPHEIQQLTDMFKDWLTKGNVKYEQLLRQKKQQDEENQRKDLQQKIDKEKIRREAIKNIKF